MGFPKNWKYRPGDHLVVDDISGFRRYASQCRMRWDNVLMPAEQFETRHPQDFLRARQDKIAVDGPVRPEGEDRFMENPMKGIEDL